jgi:hypothetical protein
MNRRIISMTIIYPNAVQNAFKDDEYYPLMERRNKVRKRKVQTHFSLFDLFDKIYVCNNYLPIPRLL